MNRPYRAQALEWEKGHSNFQKGKRVDLPGASLRLNVMSSFGVCDGVFILLRLMKSKWHVLCLLTII